MNDSGKLKAEIDKLEDKIDKFEAKREKKQNELENEEKPPSEKRRAQLETEITRCTNRINEAEDDLKDARQELKDTRQELKDTRSKKRSAERGAEEPERKRESISVRKVAFFKGLRGLNAESQRMKWKKDDTLSEGLWMVVPTSFSNGVFGQSYLVRDFFDSLCAKILDCKLELIDGHFKPNQQVLYGPPGLGKSTFLTHFAWYCVKNLPEPIIVYMNKKEELWGFDYKNDVFVDDWSHVEENAERSWLLLDVHVGKEYFDTVPCNILFASSFDPVMATDLMKFATGKKYFPEWNADEFNCLLTTADDVNFQHEVHGFNPRTLNWLRNGDSIEDIAEKLRQCVAKVDDYFKYSEDMFIWPHRLIHMEIPRDGLKAFTLADHHIRLDLVWDTYVRLSHNNKELPFYEVFENVVGDYLLASPSIQALKKGNTNRGKLEIGDLTSVKSVNWRDFSSTNVDDTTLYRGNHGFPGIDYFTSKICFQVTINPNHAVVPKTFTDAYSKLNRPKVLVYVIPEYIKDKFAYPAFEKVKPDDGDDQVDKDEGINWTVYKCWLSNDEFERARLGHL